MDTPDQRDPRSRLMSAGTEQRCGPFDIREHQSKDNGPSRRSLLGLTGVGLAAFALSAIGGAAYPAHAATIWRHPFSVRTKQGDYFNMIRSEAYCGGPCSSPHIGVDYQPPSRAPVEVIAPAAGVVAFAGPNGGGGQTVKIEHGTLSDGSSYVTEYLHMGIGTLAVARGNNVYPGTRLGTMACTGTCYGRHTHINMWRNGARIDSWPLLGTAPLIGEVGPSDPLPVPPLRKKSMYIVHDVVNGTGSFVVTDNGVWGLNGAQEEVLWRIMGSPTPAYVPLAASEITMIDQVLRANLNYND
jgi:murein DD-endopeptidase MepM/ murein hydrolase activator NlpD